ncbi:MAG: PQQ-binding-like beta-propeller repeat protein [Pseudomonadales bacterium]
MTINCFSHRFYKAISGVLFCLSLAACDKAEPPTEQWESAVQGLYSAVLSNDGKYGIVGSIQHGGSLWDMKRKERLFNWNHAKGDYTLFTSTAFSPDSQYAATASERTIVLWETTTGAPVWFWTAPGKILSMALTPNGDYAVLGLANHTAVLFDIKNGGIKRTFTHQGEVRSVSLSGNGKLLVTGSDDETAKLWDIQSGEQLHSWQHGNQLITTAVSANGTYVFTAAQADKAVIWNAKSGKEVRTLPIKTGSYIVGAAYSAARFSEDEKQLMTGTNSQLVQLWDIKSGAQLKRWRISKKDKWKPTSATVLAVAFSGKGKYLAIGSNGLSYKLQ